MEYIGRYYTVVTTLRNAPLHDHLQHGYEFEDRWDDLEALCAALGGREGVWYATNIELVDYWNACMAVRSSLDGTIVQNLSAIPVHASWGPDHGHGDGAVAVADAVLLGRALNEDPKVGFSEKELENADFDDDGWLTLEDLAAMLDQLAG